VTQPLPPAGWYPNPDHTPSLRWWDGTQWTDAVQAATPPPVPQGPGVPPAAAVPPGQPVPPAAAVPPGQPAQGPPPLPYAYAPAAPLPGPPGRTGRTGIIVAIVFLVVAGAVFIPSVVFVARTAINEIVRAPTMEVPGTRSLSLTPGDYFLFDPGGSGAIGSSDVSVAAPDGSSLPVALRPVGTETITRNGVGYTATVGFRADTAGRYTITVHPSVGAAHEVVVAQSLTSVARDVAGWAIGIVFGVLLGIAGIVILIVSLVQRGRARRAYPVLPTGRP
jgi:hypothetical protein